MYLGDSLDALLRNPEEFADGRLAGQSHYNIVFVISSLIATHRAHSMLHEPRFDTWPRLRVSITKSHREQQLNGSAPIYTQDTELMVLKATAELDISQHDIVGTNGRAAERI